MITVAAAAKRLKVTSERVCQLIRTNRLYAVKVGRIWMIPALDIAPCKTKSGWPKGKKRKATK